MKILVIYQYFGTPKGSWSTRIYELTRRWVANGADVTVITSPYDKSDIQADGLVSFQKVEGIRLIVLNSGDSNRFPKWKRVFRAITFSVLSSYYALRTRSDVVLASSGPITVAIPGLLVKWLKNTPLVFEVRDLWPLGGIVMGKINNPIVQKALLWFEHLIYRHAQKIVTCSKGQKDNIEKRLGYTEKLEVIPNACDIDLFGAHQSLSVKQKKLLNGHEYILHTGSLGFIHNVSYLIDVAEHLQKKYHSGIKVVLIGDGAEREMLEEKVRRSKLKNVLFLGQMPKQQIVPWLSNCLLTVFTTLNNEVQDTSSPNKVFDSFAAGKPVVQTTRGWIKELIEQHECGFNADPENPGTFAEKVMKYSQMSPDDKKTLNCNAKTMAETEFNRDLLADRYLKILKHA